MRPVYIATAYLGPIQQYCKMLQYPEVRIETAENYVKQTYRNRCVIAAANGPLSLSIPIVKPDTLKCQTKDIRISDHGNWRHLHWNALVSAYNMSPFLNITKRTSLLFTRKNMSFIWLQWGIASVDLPPARPASECYLYGRIPVQSVRLQGEYDVVSGNTACRQCLYWYVFKRMFPVLIRFHRHGIRLQTAPESWPVWHRIRL